MTTTATSLFVRKATQRSHHKVELVIEWDGVSLDDLKTMAQFHIQHTVEHQLRYGKGEVPTKKSVCALDFIHATPAVEVNLREPQPTQRMSEFEKILAGLPTKERLAILESLKS